MPAPKSNPVLVDLIDELKTASHEHDATIWGDVARRLEKPRRVWDEVNVSRLQRVLEEDDTVVIAGKILGTGRIRKAVTVAAFQASSGAREKIEDAGGEVLRIAELLERTPDGEGVRIVG